MPKSKEAQAQAAEVLFATTVHVAADVAGSPEEQLDTAIRASFPGFDPDRMSVEYGEAVPHRDGGEDIPVTVTAAPPSPADAPAE